MLLVHAGPNPVSCEVMHYFYNGHIGYVSGSNACKSKDDYEYLNISVVF